MSVSKTRIVQYLQRFDIQYPDVITFLKEDCRIEKGFEAQMPGMQTFSPTTTGHLVYVLNSMDELSSREQETLAEDLIDLRLDDSWTDSEFAERQYTNVWATSQCLLGLLSIDRFDETELEDTVQWLCRQQHPNGGWSFSGVETEKIIYHPYNILVLNKYAQQHELAPIEETLESALTFARGFTPTNEIEKILQAWAIDYLAPESQTDLDHVDFHAIVNDEFANYVVQEHSIYPFSLKYYTPSTYLFSSTFLPPDHPFHLFLIQYLVRTQIDGRAWSHVQPLDDLSTQTNLTESSKPFSYCTGLAIWTLYNWARDMVTGEYELDTLPPLRESKSQLHDG